MEKLIVEVDQLREHNRTINKVIMGLVINNMNKK